MQGELAVWAKPSRLSSEKLSSDPARGCNAGCHGQVNELEADALCGMWAND